MGLKQGNNMNQQAKILITPFEVFSSAAGGTTLSFSILLMYTRLVDITKIIEYININYSINNLIMFLLLSFLLGSLFSGVSYRIYKYIRELFGMNEHVDKLNIDTIRKYRDVPSIELSKFNTLSYSEQLSFFLSRKSNTEKTVSLCLRSVIPYIRVNDNISTRVYDNHLAQHIMYRTFSLGVFLMLIVTSINLLKIGNIDFSPILFILVMILLIYVSFKKAYHFKKWAIREIVYSFYQISYNDYFIKNKVEKE